MITRVARMTLLDIRVQQYAHACIAIAIVQNNLNTGTIFVTLFPNFNLRLDDPLIYNNLKVQLQIVEATDSKNLYSHYRL